MKNALTLAASLVLTLLVSRVYAAPRVEGMTDLPIESLKAVEVNGELFYLSKNGRYVIQGRLTDSWDKKSLDTLDEINYSATHIQVENLGLPLEKMNTLTVGHGPNTFYSFVDPLCGFCKKMVKEAQTRTSDYTLKLIVVPALGEESNRLAKRLFCAADKSKAVEAFLNNNMGEMAINEACDPQYYDLTLTFAQLVGVNSVPFVIAPDGRFRSGAGDDLWEWLERGH